MRREGEKVTLDVDTRRERERGHRESVKAEDPIWGGS